MRGAVANLAVAPYAVLVVIGMNERTNRLRDQLSMTAQAIPLNNLAIVRSDADRFVKVLHRELLGMAPAILSLDQIFAGKTLGEVAVVADGDALVAPFLPGVKVLPHDMAVGADRRIIGKIRAPLGIIERKKAKSDQDADQRGDQRHPGLETG